MASQQQNLVTRHNNMREVWSTEFQDPRKPFEIQCMILQVLHGLFLPAWHFPFCFVFFLKNNECTFPGRVALLGLYMVSPAYKSENIYWLGK